MTVETPPRAENLHMILLRDARLFRRRPDAMDELAGETIVKRRLAPDQIHHPAGAADVVVRLGRLRLSEFLPDGREVCRAVLQAGSCLAVRDAAAHADPTPGIAADSGVLMALGGAELWELPSGTFHRLGVGGDPAGEENR